MDYNSQGLSTTKLIQMLIKSFSQNDGIENFGFILATYELDKEQDDFQVEVLLNTAGTEITTDLVDGISFAFNQFIESLDDEDDEEDDYFNYN